VRDKVQGQPAASAPLSSNVTCLLASCLLAVLSYGCASTPVSEEQRALNICLWSQDQPGWRYLPEAPTIADALRSAIVSSGVRPLPEPGEYEWWFVHADGRYLRCTNRFAAMFEAEGMPAVCGSSTHTFTPAGESWSVEDGDLVLCNKRR